MKKCQVAVLSKILFGSLEVDSYDNVDTTAVEGEGEGGEGDQQSNRKKNAAAATTNGVVAEAGADASGKKNAERITSSREGGAQQRDGAVVFREQKRTAAVTAESRAFLLTPWKGNLHAFKAPVACAVFDVLVRVKKAWT